MPAFVEKPTIVTLAITVLPEAKQLFVDWQAKYNSQIITFPGFASLEIIAPPKEGKAWYVVQRFSDMKSAAEWRQSKACQELMRELNPLIVNNGAQETATDERNINGVTEVFITEVNPGKEEVYRKWSAKIHHVEANFPGFRGVYIQSPKEGKSGHWITLLQFDTVETLDRWLESPERKVLLNECSPLISSLETNRVISPYGGWFASIVKMGEIPPVWKQTLIVLLVLFPIVMLELKYLLPLLAHYNPVVSTFIGNAISVTLISFPAMPIAIWLLGWWLLPDHDKESQWTLIGTVLVFLLYLMEILIFWNFL